MNGVEGPMRPLSREISIRFDGARDKKLLGTSFIGKLLGI